jgi:hypothetical protein
MTGIAEEQRELPSPRRSVAARVGSADLDAVTALERELRSRRNGRYGKLAAGIVLVLAVAGAAYARKGEQPTDAPPRFVTQAIEQRDISETVESTASCRTHSQLIYGTML